MIRKESYYDPEVVEVFINALRGATVDELKDARAKSKLLAVATKQWKKGLRRSSLNKSLHFPSTVVEIALQQLKLGMKVDSIHFGGELYIRNCRVDQSIIDNVTRLTEFKGKNPIIKIFLNVE